MDISNYWPLLILIVISIVVIAGKLKSKNKSPGDMAYCYMDDTAADPNGIMDWVAALGLGRLYNNPVFMGASHSPVPVFEGAKRFGKQGPSPLAMQIVKQARANKVFHVCVGGPWTDLASAIEYDRSIVPKLKVYLIGAWNKRQDPYAVNVVLTSGVKAKIFEDQDIMRAIRLQGKEDGERFVNGVLRQCKAGKQYITAKLISWAVDLNKNQAGTSSPLRLADTITIYQMFNGNIDSKGYLKAVQKGVDILP